MQHREPSGIGAAFKKFCDIVARLRAPGGCPWDREQTPLSLRGDLVEETYECIEAIDDQDPAHIKEELGDIFLLVTMLAYMHEQEGLFTVSDVLEAVSEKLVRRHPHVFGTGSIETSFGGINSGGINSGGINSGGISAGGETAPAGSGAGLSSKDVLQNWAKIKVEQEGRKPKDSILDEVRRGFPPLDRAWKLQKKAAQAGFDWPDTAGVTSKIREELEEVEAAIAAAGSSGPCNTGTTGKPADAALEEELGDLLFSVVNLCRFFDIEPSVALQRTNIKFTERFKYVEKRMKENGQEMKAGNLAVMDQYWNEAKG